MIFLWSIVMLLLIFIFVVILNSGNQSSSGIHFKDELSDDNLGSKIPISVELEISYIDSEGQSSCRCVEGRYYDPDGPHLIGLCSLRHDIRTFRLDRIKEATDLSTGEVLNVKRLRSFLRSHRTKRREN